ncbi:MAG TPA: PilZ domain-containing protein [Terriglobales bacterium]|nr:PilZ domain-containing protein [Terriglobales bacterium]
MGTTTEPRKAVEVPVRVFGTDCDGKPFYENLTTIDVSLHGAKLRGLRARLQVDEIIGLTYGKNKGHFRVKWIGTPGTATEGVLGLVNLNPGKPLWDFPVPQTEVENTDVQPPGERRRWPRVKCSVSVELHTPGQAVIWAKASDLSPGGCFIEMAIPLHKGASFEIALWLGEAKLHLQGQVVSMQPGFGNGVRFLGVNSEHETHLRRFIETIAPHQDAGIALAKGSGL